MIEYAGILHHSVLVKDLNRSLAFYQSVLGLKLDNSRPSMSFEGAWLWVGKQAIHLLQLDNPDQDSNRPEHGGRDRHVAIAINKLAPLKKKFEHQGVPYTMSQSGRVALFCRDPDGNAIEIIETTNV